MGTCLKCNKETKNPKYCSLHCANSCGKRNHVWRICKTCSRKTKNPKFCSRHCSAKTNNIVGRIGKRNLLNWKLCITCGKETNNVKYCSLKCQHKYNFEIKIENFIKTGIVNSLRIWKRHLMITIGKCSECEITNNWNNKHLVFDLDHIDGVGSNNKIDNLRLLCPNCHSQTLTYKGRNQNSTRTYRKKYYKPAKHS